MKNSIRSHIAIWALAIFAASGLRSPAENSQKLPTSLDGEKRIEVTASVTYYSRGPNLDELDDTREGEMILEGKPTKEDAWDIVGVVMKITKPEKFKGMIYTMHHDGMVASGDPTKLLPHGKPIRLLIRPSDIGKMSFRECSLTPLALFNRSEKKKANKTQK